MMTLANIWLPGLFLSAFAIGVLVAEYNRAVSRAVSKRKQVTRKAVSVPAFTHKKPQPVAA